MTRASMEQKLLALALIASAAIAIAATVSGPAMLIPALLWWANTAGVLVTLTITPGGSR